MILASVSKMAVCRVFTRGVRMPRCEDMFSRHRDAVTLTTERAQSGAHSRENKGHVGKREKVRKRRGKKGKEAKEKP